MKKILLSLIALCWLGSSFADEGMWLPMLIGKNIDSMRAEGCKLSADDIYNVNKASLKDAVVIFGGGCTGEIISDQGLLITNHHCGYGAIAGLSTVEHNYLEDGFWSKNLKAELPVKGLTVKFLVRMEDVTDLIRKAGDKRNAKKSQKGIQDAITDVETKASENGKYMAQVRPFLAGNQYVLLVYQVYKDIRLVATPPRSLGKFGGNTDNWTWPRHTCDFSVFRVYANAQNQPADYSDQNVPFHPKRYLSISLSGVDSNDFAMVMGYPGRTQRYETSYGVNLNLDITAPSIVKIRDNRLSIMRKYMKEDPAVNLKLASEYASVSNYWKYYIGQSEQLKRLKVVDKKKKGEVAFTQWAKQNQPGDSKLMEQYAKLYSDYRPFAKQVIYYREAFGASKLNRIAASAYSLYQTLSEKKPKDEDIKAGVKKLQAARSAILDDLVPGVDRDIFTRMTELYYEEVPKAQLPDVYQKVIFKQFGNDTLNKSFENFANYVYSHTFLLDEAAFTTFCAHPDLETMENDPAMVYAISFQQAYNDNAVQKLAEFQKGKDDLDKQYLAGLMRMHPNRLMYPDANSTMRVTYGQVKGYSPQDAVFFGYETDIKGVLAKYIPGDDEFDLPKGFPELVQKGEFGPYTNDKGSLTTCFISNNDITGGNSGSPVLDKNGNLLGLAFDGNWEAMSGDIAFDKQFKRTISVDIRYVLWVMEYYGHANNLIQEMTFAR